MGRTKTPNMERLSLGEKKGSRSSGLTLDKGGVILLGAVEEEDMFEWFFPFQIWKLRGNLEIQLIQLVRIFLLKQKNSRQQSYGFCLSGKCFGG